MAQATCVVVEDGAQCASPQRRGKMCGKHHTRFLRYGDPLVTRTRANGAVLVALQAAARATGDECVFLPGRKPGTRPKVVLNGSEMNGSRAVWMIAHGDPGEAWVLHTCHRGEDGCISIRHLYLGDAARNMLDMAEADRSTRGERHVNHKLSDGDVAAIRSRYRPGTRWAPGNSQTLAAEFGVDRRQIDRVARRQSRT